jgi:hypothetical protein
MEALFCNTCNILQKHFSISEIWRIFTWLYSSPVIDIMNLCLTTILMTVNEQWWQGNLLENSFLLYKLVWTNKIVNVGIFMYLLTYLLTHSLHDAGYYLKSYCHSACQKNPAFFMEPKGSLLCSQKPTTGPYPELAKSSLPHWSPSS